MEATQYAYVFVNNRMTPILIAPVKFVKRNWNRNHEKFKLLNNTENERSLFSSGIAYAGFN